MASQHGYNGITPLTKSKKYTPNDTVDGQNPAPVEVGSFSHYLQGFIHPRWLFGISSTNSMLNIRKCHSLSHESRGENLQLVGWCENHHWTLVTLAVSCDQPSFHREKSFIQEAREGSAMDLSTADRTVPSELNAHHECLRFASFWPLETLTNIFPKWWW